MVHSPAGSSGQLLWQTWDQKAQKEGAHATVYFTNGDTYTGCWHDNLRHGPGKYTSTRMGYIYDGEWKNGYRCGRGSLSLFDKTHKLWRVAVVGEWDHDEIQGKAVKYYSDNTKYEGEFYQGLRHGWGIETKENGPKYIGQFLNDKKSGDGVCHYPNGDRYEGAWYNDMREGQGKYFYVKRGQLFKGEYIQDQPRCGTFETIIPPSKEPWRTEIFSIPPCELKDPKGVMDAAMKEAQRARRQYTTESTP